MILQVNKDKIKYILCNEYLCYNYTHCDIDSNNLTNNEYPCSISIYLLYNWKTIKRLNSFNSKAFNYILSILGIEKKDVRGWTIDDIVTRLYSRSTNSKDKELSRSIIKDRITKHIYSIYNRSFSHKYPSMNFTAKLIIE